MCVVMLGMTTRAVFAQSEPPPRLLIVSPSPGEVIQGNEVRVVVALPPEITLADYHVHLWLDTLSVHDNEHAVSLEKIPEHTYANVFSGLHRLYAEVYKNDHTPLDQKMAAEVEFETVGEELKPSPPKWQQGGVPPEGNAGLFLPRGQSNSILATLIIIITVAILWIIFVRKTKH